MNSADPTAPGTPGPGGAAPRPVPSPVPGPPRPRPPRPTAAAPAPSASASWGRVDEDGSVYVRTAEGERKVGQWLGGDPDEGLQFFARKYDALVFEVELLEKRVASGAVAPDDAAGVLKQLRATVADVQAVGDLDALDRRLEALAGLIGAQREKRRAERAAKLSDAKVEKERIAAEAERLAGSNDWKAGADRLRALLDEWKELPRLEKSADDALWRRFSTARTTYTRRRKQHFAELNEKREGARAVKEKLVKEAEALSGSTDWGPTAGAYRELMRRWKEAGPAPKGVDDQLWKKFRSAQDVFFRARDEVAAATDAEFAENATKKEALLVEAEALLPVTDLAAAKAAFRDLADRWDAAGKVPRDRMKELENRMRKVEQAIRAVEDEQWSKSDPEKSARADDMIGKLEAGIAETQAKLDKATAAGDERRVKDLEAELANKQPFLDLAKKAAAEFG